MGRDEKNIILSKTVKKLNERGLRCTLNDAIWIVDRYFYYWAKLIANGFKISTTADFFGSLAKSNLSYEIIRKTNKNERKKILFSSLLYGYFFEINISIINTKNSDFIFYPDKNIRNEIQDVLNTDIVFKLTMQ